MFIDYFKIQDKGNQPLKKSGSQASLNGFLEKSKPRSFFSFQSFSKVSSLSLFLVALFFFVGNFKTAHAAWWSDSKSSEQEKNYPGKPPKKVFQNLADQIEKIDQATETSPLVPRALHDFQQKLEKDDKDDDEDENFGMTNASYAEMEREIQKALYGSFKSLDFDTAFRPCVPNFSIYQPSRVHAFETNALLSGFASEPLFLESKEELSVELRPFTLQNQNDFKNITSLKVSEIGIVLGLRKQYHSHFFSSHLLSGKSFIRGNGNYVHDKSLFLALTGGVFKNHASGSLTLTTGGIFSEINREDKNNRQSNPKTFCLGLSPMIVFYPPSFPIDFFVGGDLFFTHRFPFTETQIGRKFCKISYKGFNDFLWRMKIGPSYTFKRSSEKRLYQLVFSLSSNIQSAMPDHVSFSPNILFESQGHKNRGGWLLKLGGTLSSDRRAISLSYGLRL